MCLRMVSGAQQNESREECEPDYFPHVNLRIGDW
jgi:hypothetical protein